MNRHNGKLGDQSGSPPPLQIAGLVPFSTVDWPGRLVATVFCQGCPWRCTYCHNHEILSFTRPGQVPTQQLWTLLHQRHGLLDGVVFSGGEALAQPGLAGALSRTKTLGYDTGLHSAGSYPQKLKTLLERELLDWVGHDIKSGPEEYAQITGVKGAGRKAWQALEYLLAASVAYEIRLTVYPGWPGNAVTLAHRLKEQGVTHFALQETRMDGTSSLFRAQQAQWLANSQPNTSVQNSKWQQTLSDWAQQIQELGFEKFTFRPANISV